VPTSRSSSWLCSSEGARLGTLTRAASALGCGLVCAFVPRVPLDEQIRLQAERVLDRDFAGAAGSGSLTDQGFSGDAARDTREDLVARISTQRGLWRAVE